jgi:hypothetical protein
VRQPAPAAARWCAARRPVDSHVDLVADGDSGAFAQLAVEADQVAAVIHRDRGAELGSVDGPAHRRARLAEALLRVERQLDDRRLAVLAAEDGLETLHARDRSPLFTLGTHV